MDGTRGDGSAVLVDPFFANRRVEAVRPTFAAVSTPVHPEARVRVGGTEALKRRPTQQNDPTARDWLAMVVVFSPAELIAESTFAEARSVPLEE